MKPVSGISIVLLAVCCLVSPSAAQLSNLLRRSHPDQDTCGVGNPDGQRTDGKPSGSSSSSSAQSSDRGPPEVGIVGGNDAKPGEYPWQIHLRKQHADNKRKRSTCGGTIISPRWVVTAGHCVQQCEDDKQRAATGDEMKLYAGDHTQSDKKDGVQEFEVERVVMHEKYAKPCSEDDESSDRIYDIALVKTKKDMYTAGDPKLTKDGYGSINAACMPPANYVYNGSAIASGWGRTENDKADTLQAVELNVLTTQQCNDFSKHIETDDSRVCAQSDTGGTGSGDSGGPLVAYTERGKQAVVLGAMSTSKGRNNKLPDRFSSTAYYRDWIESTTGEKFPTVKP